MASEEEEKAPSALDTIADTVEREGYKPGSPGHERRFRQLKVVHCREIRGQPSCLDCSYYDECELIKQVMRDNRGFQG